MFRRISRKSVPAALLPIALAASLLLLVPEADPQPQLVPSSGPASGPGPTPDRISLKDGRSLAGEVISQGTTHLTLRLPDGRTLLLRKEDISGEQRGPTRRGKLHRVRLRGGREVVGELISRSPSRIELRLASGTLVSLRVEDVESVEPGG